MLPRNREPTHPGHMLLEEFLKPMCLTQSEFARHLGWTYARVNEIVHGKRGISAETALSLGDVFNMESEFWLNLQRDYDLWEAKKCHKRIEPLNLDAA